MERGKILIVEDQPELAEVLDYQLQAQGFATLLAVDGLQACRTIGRERPDLILLDLLLPDLDGWEVCRMIRSRREDDIGSVPIVMLTALSSMDDRLRGLDLGADAYLTKPYAIREVILTVRRLLERRRQEQALGAEIARLRQRVEHTGFMQDLLGHELRNQLLVLRGYSGLLGRPDSGREEVHSQTCLRAIDRSSQSLGHLAENLLLLSRHESEGLALPPDHPAVAVLAEEILDFYRPFADRQQLELRLDLGPIDPHPAINGLGLRVILSNLVENAIKYSPAGTTVAIRLSAPPGRRLEVSVEDHGAGIPEADRDRIFQRFTRGAHPPGDFPGSGLGLYLARTLARTMGGELRHEPRQPAGSRFVAAFPALPSGHPE